MILREYQRIQLQQLSFFLKAIGDLSISDLETEALQSIGIPVLNSGLELRDPGLRKKIWNFFNSNFLADKNMLQTCHISKETPKHMILPSLYLSFFEREENFQRITRKIQSIRSGKMILFRDASAYKLLLKTLDALAKEKLLTTKDKKALLSHTLGIINAGKPDKHEIIKALQSIKGVMDFGSVANFKKIQFTTQEAFLQSLNEAHMHAFSQVVPIRQNNLNFMEKFQNSFGTFRIEDALLIYASALKKLPEQEKIVLLPALAECMEEVVEGDYPASRYMNSDHLDFIFKGREVLKSIWEKGEKHAFKTCYSEWTIEDTDDLCDLFLCGTEIKGSCQHIDGNPKYNKCLLGYVIDGKNRLLAIKDHNGTIKARAILRLLWNAEEKQPILFLERIYPRLVSTEMEQALIEFAVHRSEALGIPLASKEVGNGGPTDKKLISLTSRAPYEYVDAGDGVHRNGRYAINGVHYIKK